MSSSLVAKLCNALHVRRSSNKVAVASRHSWTDNPETINNEDARKNRAMDTFRRISSELTAIIKAVNDSFVSDPLTVELFSAEGQLCSCFVGHRAIAMACSLPICDSILFHL